VPNVVGMTKKEAKKALENFTVEYAGTGDKVVSQSPEADGFITPLLFLFYLTVLFFNIQSFDNV